MKRRIFGSVAVFAAIALIVAGCGRSSDTASTSDATLTKSEFLKKGDAICAASKKEVEIGLEEFAKKEGITEKSPPNEAQSKKLGETLVIPASYRLVEGIRALGIPQGDEGELEELLTSIEGAIETAEEDPAALIEEEEGSEEFAKANREAREYGLTVCAEENEG